MTPDHWTAYVAHWADTMHDLGAATAAGTDPWRVVAIEHAAQDAARRWTVPLLDLEDDARADVDELTAVLDAHGQDAYRAGHDGRIAPDLPDDVRARAVDLLPAEELTEAGTVPLCEYCGARGDAYNPHGDPGVHGDVDVYLVDGDIPCPVGTGDEAAWDTLARALIARHDARSEAAHRRLMHAKRAAQLSGP